MKKIEEVIENLPEVKELETKLAHRKDFLHKELRAMGLAPKNVRHFLRIYGRFHKLVCHSDVRCYGHADFIDKFLESGDFKKLSWKKSQQWLEWHMKEVEMGLRRMERYPQLLENIRLLKRENELLRTELAIFRSRCKTEDEEEYSEKEPYPMRAMNIPVAEVGFSTRVSNVLRLFDCELLGDVASHTENQLLKARQFGRKSLREIIETLEYYGLHLGMDVFAVQGEAEAKCDWETGNEGELENR